MVGRPARPRLVPRVYKCVPLEDRIWKYVYFEPNTGCWLWGAAVTGAGYGKISVNARLVPAHRAMYEMLRGKIPDGLELDHKCRVPACVNPDHLEPVTHQENVLRGNAPCAIIIRRGVCAKGHDRSLENLIFTKNGKRQCRVCRKLARKGEYSRWPPEKKKAFMAYQKERNRLRKLAP